jgi:prevent-host-death family protein
MDREEGGAMQRSVSATEARVHFGDLLQRLTQDEDVVVVERGGIPQAVVLSIGEYERLLSRHDATGWRDQARAARDLVRAELGTRPIPLPEDVISAARADRDQELGGLR